MNTEQIRAIGSYVIDNLAADDCSLYLWTVNAHVEHAYHVARGWGFSPSTLCVWAKNPMGGGLGGAFGITTEYFLYARRGKPTEKRTTGTWFNWKRYYVNGHPSHSSKPDGFYDLVEQVSPGPYLEMFARRARLGWDYWGDESLQTAEVSA
jgi:N6-adenosine-specific RNA methylase IME4